jgi:hypothetical protein
MDNITDYWFEVEDLTIFHAAYWMQLGGDPRAHDYRCEHDPYKTYEEHFYEHPGGYEAVRERCEGLLSAIRVGLIKVTEGVRGSGHDFDPVKTRILKSDWIQWCRRNANPELALLADQFDARRAFDRDAGPNNSEAPESVAVIQPDTATVTGDGPPCDVDIPGTLPKISVGKLAIEAAWVIERSTGRAATTKAVMQQLQNWADRAHKPDVLLNSDLPNRSVIWRTSNGASKSYTSEACGKTLAAWKKSRA